MRAHPAPATGGSVRKQCLAAEACDGRAEEKDGVMVSNCANPKCARPLHYLREGKIFIFDSADRIEPKTGKRSRRLEHYWLCGDCCRSLTLEKGPEGVRLVSRPHRAQPHTGVEMETAAAS